MPVAKLSGLGQSGQSFCGIFGTTVPFDAAKIAQLYPSHAAFSKQWSKAVDDGQGRVHQL
ncbi:MAG: alpha/beta hydrolase domain-containing protein [Acidimicrobiia bacterium]